MSKALIGLCAAAVVFVHVRASTRLNEVEVTVADMLQALIEDAENEYQASIDTMFTFLTDGLEEDNGPD